jgi:hypothetical protein
MTKVVLNVLVMLFCLFVDAVGRITYIRPSIHLDLGGRAHPHSYSQSSRVSFVSAQAE